MRGRINEQFEMAKDELADLMQVEPGRVDWEEFDQFIRSVAEQVETKGYMSQRQMKKVRELWEKYCE